MLKHTISQEEKGSLALKQHGILFRLLFGVKDDEKYDYIYEINSQTGEMSVQKEERPKIEY